MFIEDNNTDGSDEMMSQEPAFDNDQQPRDDTFKFLDEEVSEDTSPDSQPNEDEVEEEDDDSARAEDKENPVDEEEDEEFDSEDEQRVPYSRFKKQLDLVAEATSKISVLEENLAQLHEKLDNPAKPEDVEVPPEWVKLYGDSDVSKEAYMVQLQREEQLQAKAVEKAIEVLTRQQQQESQRLVDNEHLIEDNLTELQETIGKRLTGQQEDSVLQIVDEFSPVDDDGKYLSLFPFDKAYEIYMLREQTKGRATRQARTKVADLTGNASEGEVSSDDTSFTPQKWDGWESELST